MLATEVVDAACLHCYHGENILQAYLGHYAAREPSPDAQVGVWGDFCLGSV